MPIPEPHDDEGHDEFIGRCHEAMADETPDRDQRHVICEGAWEDREKEAMSAHETKSFTPTIKEADGEEGRIVAEFATLGTKDLDGDVTEPGAFGDQKVKVSAYGHGSWAGALPVGRGTISEAKDKAVADLQFFMDTDHGANTFRTVKGLDDLGEWSYGFDVIEHREPTEDERQKGIVRVLKKLKVHEVSPVLRGAGVGTRTVSVKEAGGEGLSDSDQGPEPDLTPGTTTPDPLREEIAAEVGRYEILKHEVAKHLK